MTEKLNKTNEMVENICKLTVSEIIEFRDSLAGKLGISIDALASSGASSGASSEAATESSAPKTFKVILKGGFPEAQKVSILKAVKDSLNVSIIDAKKIVDLAMSEGEVEVKKALSADKAEELMQAISKAGGTCEKIAE